MDGLLISELARRSGMPATTLRFYEQQGLLTARRSRGGYRLYDDVAVDRLAFIATAKHLGLPLPEIRALLGPWEHGVCAQVRSELDPLLAHRLAEAQDRITELQAFVGRLEQARDQLAGIERDGPCDPTCAVLGQHPATTGPVLGVLPPPVTTGDGEDGVETVIACTLTGSDRVGRVDRWRAALADVTVREAVPGGLRLTFDRDRVRVGELAELTAAEARCCAFLDLWLHLGPVPVLEVHAPTDALPLVLELFGPVDAAEGSGRTGATGGASG